MRKTKALKYSLSIVSVLFLTGCMESIDRVNSPVPYPSIGGYEHSDQVAASSLLTKLSFENTLVDKGGNLNSSVVKNISYTSGVKGYAYDGSATEARYVVADVTKSITGLKDFTIAFWMKSSNSVTPNPPGQGRGAQGIFTIVRPSEFWGGINVFIENPNPSLPGRIRLKLGVENGRSGVAWRGQGVIANIDNKLNQWVHVVYSYSAKESRCYVYIDGEAAKNLDGFAYAPSGGTSLGYAPWFADNPGGLDNPNNAPLYGDIQLVGVNGKVVLGTHQFETSPPQNNGTSQDWATSFAGQLDEFRVYNTPLSAAEVSALYRLEKDGR